ncbi:MAG: anti-sigma factor [Chthoniobacterales bacterium]|nr:anti-sigma factor [Chthoniobacterales bacterium]
MRNCQDTLQWLDAYWDNELDPVNTLEIEQHLQGCTACSQSYEELRTLGIALSDLPRHRIPAVLREQVRSALRAEAGEESKTIPFPPTARASWPWLTAIAAMLLLCALLAGVLLTSRPPPASASERESQEVIASHIRSLMASHLADVISTDEHTVKPWFDGKLDFSPPVIDFAKEGFPLIGGRLDYLTDKPVAAIVYRRDKHVINLFCRPSGPKSPDSLPQLVTHQGYHVVTWTQQGRNCWVVSDLNEAELQQFVELVRRPTPG